MANFKLENMGNLEGLVALVTGGGTGIGYMAARGLAFNGAKVYITGRRKEKLESAASIEVTGPGSLVPLSMDVQSKESIKVAVEFIKEADGKLDILMNNAGVAPDNMGFVSDHSTDGTSTLGQRLFEQDSFENWAKAFATNTTAAYFVTNGFLDLLLKGAQSRPGETSSVINVSSCFAHTDLSMNNFAYCASKVAIEQVTKSLATEYGLHKIPVRVNGIAPGTFASDMTSDAASLSKFVVDNPLPGGLVPAPVLRIGRDEEIASTVVYLASRGGGFTNGHVIVMDGGWNIVNP